MIYPATSSTGDKIQNLIIVFIFVLAWYFVYKALF